MSAYWPSLIGGMLLGLSAVALLLLDGRIAGISGIGLAVCSAEGRSR